MRELQWVIQSRPVRRVYGQCCDSLQVPTHRLASVTRRLYRNFCLPACWSQAGTRGGLSKWVVRITVDEQLARASGNSAVLLSTKSSLIAKWWRIIYLNILARTRRLVWSNFLCECNRPLAGILATTRGEYPTSATYPVSGSRVARLSRSAKANSHCGFHSKTV